MLFKVAWRNIWRSRVRSLVVITALALGLWAGIFASAFVNGMMQQKVESVIALEMSHFQFHKKDFRDDIQTKIFMENGYEIRDDLLNDPLVQEVSARTINMVMISTANGTGGIRAVGISPKEEMGVTIVKDHVIEGDYFGGDKRNPIVISQKTAQKYKVGLRSKMVLTLQDINGEITAAAFRVVGIYQTGNNMYDAANVFVLREDIQKLAGIGNGIHEIAVLLKHHEPAEEMAMKYQEKYADLEVLSWMDLSTGMRYMVEVMGMYTLIIVGIILLALLFGIVNTMLMAVLERTREIGMLMAIGMNKTDVFKMIMVETLYLSLVGGPLGLILSWLSIMHFGSAGIDLGGAAYEDLGFSNQIFPSLEAIEYLKVSVMVFVMAIIASIFPARKALKLKPVEAIRKI